MVVGLIAPTAAARVRRRLALGLLALIVLVIHACVTQRVIDSVAEFDKDVAMPPRIEVAYVRDMALSAPPPSAQPAAPPAAPRPRVRRAAKPVHPASAPQQTPTIEEPPVAASEPASEAASAPRLADATPPAPATSDTPAAASAPDAPASAASAPAFEWPASTRMSYILTGNYRGEVNGSAQVEWIRQGARYQVHLDLVVGPSVAPIITRRMSSDGEITETGLSPRRYDQDTKVVLRERNRATILFEPGSVVLANGDRRDSVPGVQDTASQFVQLTYVFSTRPELLRIGGTVDIPLALPHKVDVWTYDVVEEETLNTNFGPLPTIHLKPRRRSEPKANELSAEIWFAPQLRYLPVRIRISQGAENYLDLLISKRPEIASQ